MTNHNHTWALVLAAGEGSRLHALTTTADGVAGQRNSPVPTRAKYYLPEPSVNLDSFGSSRHQPVGARKRLSVVCAVMSSQGRR
jgi:hypothetical protein